MSFNKALHSHMLAVLLIVISVLSLVTVYVFIPKPQTVLVISSQNISSSTFIPTSSSFSGYYPIFVSDICNSQPIQGATVQFQGQTQITNNAGTANFQFSSQGTMTGVATVSDPDYQTYSQSVTVSPYAGAVVELNPSGGCSLQNYTTTWRYTISQSATYTARSTWTQTPTTLSWTQTASNPIFTQPTYYQPLGDQCSSSALFHDALLEVHVITQDGKYIYNGLSTHVVENAFGVLPLPILTFSLGGRTYSSGGTLNYNGICLQAPSSLGWVDVITVSVTGYPSISFSWHPTSREHSIIQVIEYMTSYGSNDVILSTQQGNPVITNVIKS